MPEILTLAAPVQTDPGATVFRIALLIFDLENAVIKVQLAEWSGSAFVVGGKRVPVAYEGAIATTLMTALNKANLSTTSLYRRVMDRLLADGKIPAGTASGVAD